MYQGQTEVLIEKVKDAKLPVAFIPKLVSVTLLPTDSTLDFNFLLVTTKLMML